MDAIRLRTNLEKSKIGFCAGKHAVRELIKQDRQVTYREIQSSLGINMRGINQILHEELTVKKICSRWIPHNLTIAQKKNRVN